MSGGTDLNDRVGLVFIIGFHAERAHLEVAILLRDTEKRQSIAPDELSPLPPPGAGPGGGGSCRDHVFFFEDETRTLWLNGKPWLPLGDVNVVLCDATDLVGEAPLSAGELRINQDLGPEPSGEDFQKRFWCSQQLIAVLTERLEESTAVQAFVSP